MATGTRNANHVPPRTAGEPLSRSILEPNDELMPDAPPDFIDPLEKLIIAFDFGTTFSSVAYARIYESTTRNGLRISDVSCVGNFPDAALTPRNGESDTRYDVPTELWYSEQAESDDGFSGDEEIDNAAGGDVNATMYWGFGVHKQLVQNSRNEGRFTRIRRFKLLLDHKKETRPLWGTLNRTLTALKKSRRITNIDDIYYHFFLELFRHTKTEILKLTDVTINTPIEFVLCVPAVWPSKACRKMQSAMDRAATQSELKSTPTTTISNMFIVSEPEGAAGCVLEEHRKRMKTNEAVVILDAGGGTIDAITYQVAKSDPLRLSAEIVPPGTKLCGASFINERLDKLLRDKLADEKYLFKTITREALVKSKVIEFEHCDKKSIDVNNKSGKLMGPIQILHLEANKSKRFRNNLLFLQSEEIIALFQPSLDGAWTVLEEQLAMAKEKGYSVRKVILVGGFGNSPSLYGHIDKKLKDLWRLEKQDIEILASNTPGTAVARGAVLRAFNKKSGPSRTTTCSYGVLQTEPYQPTEIPQHRAGRTYIDPVDGEEYVDDTIFWFIQKGLLLDQTAEFVVQRIHNFKLDQSQLLCKVQLYVSDYPQESNYQLNHQVNRDKAELMGSFQVDMTSLRTEGQISPVKPSNNGASSEELDLYWQVCLELVIRIGGRNLYYDVRWPPREDGREPLLRQRSYIEGEIPIAAAFVPGTD